MCKFLVAVTGNQTLAPIIWAVGLYPQSVARTWSTDVS